MDGCWPNKTLLQNPKSESTQPKAKTDPISEPKLNVPPKPNLPTKPRTTISAHSSLIREDSKEGNLIQGTWSLTLVDQKKIDCDEIKWTRAKTFLCTSIGDEFYYLPDDVVEENHLAFELREKQQLQDQRDLNAALRLAAKEGDCKNPLSSQVSTLKQIEKDKLAEKNKDLQWCSHKINFKKPRRPITSWSINGERPIKKKPERVIITIGRSNIHIVSHLVHKLDMYG